MAACQLTDLTSNTSVEVASADGNPMKLGGVFTLPASHWVQGHSNASSVPYVHLGLTYFHLPDPELWKYAQQSAV
eukprot:5663056-Ditylum_brightwellii.AAC.1